MRYGAIILLCALCSSIILGGCASNKVVSEEKKAKKPERIVSVTLGTDEILIDLVPTHHIAALSHLADDPGMSNIVEKAKAVPKKIKANAETVIGLQPDLVILADWLPVELAQSIRDAGITVYVYKTPANIEETKKVITQIAALVDEIPAGEKMIANMDVELTKIVEQVKKVPADKRMIVVRFSLMGGSGGKGTSFDDICHYAGVDNGASLAGLNKEGVLSKEQIVQINPDIMIMPSLDYTGKTNVDKFKENVQNDPAFQSIKAVQQKKLIPIRDGFLSCSSQYAVYGVQALAFAAYPEYVTQ